jgi:preprotein translocase subunit SecA
MRFAVAREAAWRTLKQKPFKVQIIGASGPQQWRCRRNEDRRRQNLNRDDGGLPQCLNGQRRSTSSPSTNTWPQRDADWMGQIYRFLGLTVGVQPRQRNRLRREESRLRLRHHLHHQLRVGFRLSPRQHGAGSLEGRVLSAALEFTVVDEADSILVDESRTPLIISGGNRAAASQYQVADRFVKSLAQRRRFHD